MPAFHFRQRLPGFFRAAPYPQILNIPEINDLGQRRGLGSPGIHPHGQGNHAARAVAIQYGHPHFYKTTLISRPADGEIKLSLFIQRSAHGIGIIIRTSGRIQMGNNAIRGARQMNPPFQPQSVFNGNGLQPFKRPRDILAEHTPEGGVCGKFRLHPVEQGNTGQFQSIRRRQIGTLPFMAQLVAVGGIAMAHQGSSGVGVIPSVARVGKAEGMPQFMGRTAYVNGGVLSPGHLETAALHHFRIQKAGGIQPFLVTGPPRALVAEAAAVIRTHAVRKLANDQHMFLLNINPLGSQHLPGGFPGDGAGALHAHLAHGFIHIGIMNNQLAPFIQIQLECERRETVGLHLVRIICLNILQNMIIPFPVSFKGRPVLERYVNHMQFSGRLRFAPMIGAQRFPGGTGIGGIPGINRPADGQTGKLRSLPVRGGRNRCPGS